ncbi:MAG: hypothetical protein J6Q50_00765 [Clostridia bacterium]|nr:hypothetical protein [Clostridia bacterium]
MKKVISLVMALVMMLAITVPVFANTVTFNEGDKTNDVQIKTDTSKLTGDGTYTVTIPSTMPIAWNTISTEFDYSVTSTLKADKAVNITVLQKNKKMTATDADIKDDIVYSLAGTVNATTSKPSVQDETFKFTVEIAQSEFNTATIAEYTDTVTFTATIVNA